MSEEKINKKNQIVQLAMKTVSKNVLAPKVVRNGLLKTEK